MSIKIEKMKFWFSDRCGNVFGILQLFYLWTFLWAWCMGLYLFEAYLQLISNNTGRFIMFSMIANIYNKKTKGPTLMEFFTATRKLKRFFFWQLEMFDMCTRGDTAHIDRILKFSVITNIYNKKTKGPTLMELFTATGKMKKVFFVTTRGVRCVHHGWHIEHLKLSKKNFFSFPVAVWKFH